ncbi:hypothetical protein EAV90_16835 [Bradyrhizobium vignae]|nr:hypothetical protein EAV90_16835 [Bradyrhizobium vignae]
MRHNLCRHARLDPGIHACPHTPIDVDGRVKPGHDECASSQHTMPPSRTLNPPPSAGTRCPFP